MDLSHWSKRIAVVTGASAGIGSAICIELCRHKIMTIGLARRVEKMDEVREKLTPNQQRFFQAMKCDVSNEAEVIRVFAEIEKQHGGIDILVNNAGVAPKTTLTEDKNTADIQRVMNTNVMSLIYCTREAVKTIRKRKTNGHVIHVNSVGGHSMPYRPTLPTFGIYYTSKHAVTALAEQHRQDFMRENLDVKVTSLSPGVVHTEIMTTMGPITMEQVDQMMKLTPHIKSKDVADAVIYLLSTPSSVLVTELTIRPMNEPY